MATTARSDRSALRWNTLFEAGAGGDVGCPHPLFARSGVVMHDT